MSKLPKPGADGTTRMKPVNFAQDIMTEEQRSYIKDWNQSVYDKNRFNSAMKTRSRSIAGVLFGLVGGIYYLALNRFGFRKDDAVAELDKEYHERRQNVLDYPKS